MNVTQTVGRLPLAAAALALVSNAATRPPAAQVEPENLDRFEGEGGREAPPRTRSMLRSTTALGGDRA